MVDPKELYISLMDVYGPQGWWPLLNRSGRSGYAGRGYHPGEFPRLTEEDRFFIVLGAVLTQNTSWSNVNLALGRLRAVGVARAEDILAMEGPHLAELIRPSGYYNQKAKKLERCLSFFRKGGYLCSGEAPERQALLDLWGLGPETVDSILLYAFGVPVFVVDAYTRRLFERIDGDDGRYDYHGLQRAVMDGFPADMETYQEFHALIVKHCKDFCTKKPICTDCFISGQGCAFFSRKEV